MQKHRKNKLGCSFFLIAIPLSLFLSILLSIIVIFLIFRADYVKWQSGFENSHLSADFVKIEDNQLKSVDKKIEAFNKSTKKVDYIEITSTEFVQMLGNRLNENLPSSLRVTEGYIDPVKGAWEMYYKVQYKKSFSMWIAFDLNKDETEGTDLYITDAKVGDVSILDWGGGSIIASINDGIRDSMSLLTQKDFTGRVIRNISLEDKVIIIKGEK